MKKLLKNSYFLDFLIAVSCLLFVSVNSVFSVDLLPVFITDLLNEQTIILVYSLLLSALFVGTKYITSRFFDLGIEKTKFNFLIFFLIFFSITYMLRIFTLSRMYIIIMTIVFLFFSQLQFFIKNNKTAKNYLFLPVTLSIFIFSSFFNLNDEIEAEDLSSDQEEIVSVEEMYAKFTPSFIGEFNINETFKLKKYSICCQDFKYVKYGQKSLGSIEVVDDELYYFSGNMVFHKYSLQEMVKSKERLSFELIPSNIKDIVSNQNLFIGNWESIKDTLVFNNKLYLSYVEEVEEDCLNIRVLSANFPSDQIEFEIFLEFDECVMRTNEVFNAHQSGGKLEITNAGMIIMSLGDFRQYDKSQDPKSVFGKILEINPKNGEFTIVGLGSRNSQGLTISKTDENIFLETEHGPKGGDEINSFNIDELTNFGWPISSYGDHYDGTFKEEAPLNKSHKDFGFKEPIYYFSYHTVGSHGISDIEINHFVDSNSYFVSTLNGRVFYDLIISDNYKKISEINTYRLGERIRNIIYYKKNNLYILLLEDTPSIALLEMGTKK